MDENIMFNMPRVTIQLEGMKQQIVHAFSSHNEEVEQAIEEQLSVAIKSFPFEETILKMSREVISASIKEALEHYFKYGEGREVIKRAVVERLDKLYE